MMRPLSGQENWPERDGGCPTAVLVCGGGLGWVGVTLVRGAAVGAGALGWVVLGGGSVATCAPPPPARGMRNYWPG